jgi:2-oxoglutarate dehydrogenase E2 component (dihydrolipoamide succinyltransferase)
MQVNIVMPKLGESVTEGTVVRWLKAPGDPIERDEFIVEISTDKISTEVPAISGGILREILVEEGQTVTIGAVIGLIESDADQPASAGGAGVVRSVPASGAAPETTIAAVVPAPSVEKRSGTDRFYSPLVRSMAKREGVSLSALDAVPGSGRGGRLTKKDMLVYLENRGARRSLAERDIPETAPMVFSPSDAEIMPLDGIRKAIAEHMVRSKKISPHVTSFTEVDMTRIVRYRERVKDAFAQREGVKLTLTPFFVAAIVDALHHNPMLNASVDGDRILLWKHIHFGLAVGLEKGVVVPVIRHAERLNFIGIAKAINELISRAHDRRLSPDDLRGGTFTLTNPGMMGTLFGTPIINQPQVGIIATGAVKKRVVVMEDDALAIRSMMYLSLTYDHRVIDGLNAARFTQTITRNLEQFDFSAIGPYSAS